jgi:hypothetical protein
MRPLCQRSSYCIIAVRSLGLDALHPQPEVSPDLIVFLLLGMPLLRPLASLAFALQRERRVFSVRGDIFFVKWVIGSLVVEDVGYDSGHTILALELRTLDALEALGVGLLPEDLFFIGQHGIPSMKWNIEQMDLH